MTREQTLEWLESLRMPDFMPEGREQPAPQERPELDAEDQEN
jgi:hypothetical protein